MTEQANAELIAWTNEHGEQLHIGAYVAIWEEGVHPYGTPDNCPFCGEKQNFTEFYYNGPGSPPSYFQTCGMCGAHGPSSHGRHKRDHFGARIDAVKQWNRRDGRQPSWWESILYRLFGRVPAE